MNILQCKRCGNKWYPRIPEKPKSCPACKSRYWDEDREEDMKECVGCKGMFQKATLKELFPGRPLCSGCAGKQCEAVNRGM